MAEPRDKLAGDTRVDAVRSIGADGAPSDEVRIRRMLPADIAQGMRLKQIAGWNQTRADWARFLALEPSGCYVAERASLVVGTVTTCRFYSVAWIGMMLVDPAHRRRGIATHLMQHALDRLESAGAERIRLDATKMGVPLYRRLGFLPQLEIARYGGNPTRLTSRSRLPRVRDFQWTDWPALYELDREVSRVDRTKLLKRLLVQAGGTARVVSVEGRLQGFLLARPGSSAAQIGPFLARGEAEGRALFADALQRHRRRVLVNIPLENPSANTAAREAGLSVQRVFVRMCRGGPCHELIPSFWAGSGPEKG